MKKIYICIFCFLLQVSVGSAQINPGINVSVNNKKFIGFYNNLAESYLLNINRPFIEIQTSSPGKGGYEINLYPTAGEGYYDVPLISNTGISDRLSVVSQISLYTTAYNLLGNKTNGFGDIYLGLLLNVQSSEKFNHFIQPGIKIPTSGNKTGSGKVDFHLGASESFETEKFYNTITLNFSLLGRADFPEKSNRKLPVSIINTIDSLKGTYDYSYEPALDLEINPTYYLNDRIQLESGVSYNRNMKYDFSSLSLFGDVIYNFSNKFYVYPGADYFKYDKIDYYQTSLYAGAGYNFTDNLSADISVSDDINHSSKPYFYTQLTFTR
ncbi:MAG: hypothetical protein JSS91_07375 [Bacteroidetes bacterium]|nr:hypothetical protein [Bacteroidota bacterium]